MNTELERVIKDSVVHVSSGRYCMEKFPPDVSLDADLISKAFFVSRDVDEVTIVVEEASLEDHQSLAQEKWFNLFEVKVSKPFLTVGFLAKITDSIASKGVNVLVVSTFSKDYLLIREHSMETASRALREVGFLVT